MGPTPSSLYNGLEKRGINQTWHRYCSKKIHGFSESGFPFLINYLLYRIYWLKNVCLLGKYLKHWPSGPMLSINQFVHMYVCLSVCLSVCSLLRNCLNVFLPPLPKIICPKILEILNPWGKVVERSGFRFEHFVWKWSKIAKQKKMFFGWFCPTKHGGNHALWWIRDLWSKGVSQILPYF